MIYVARDTKLHPAHLRLTATDTEKELLKNAQYIPGHIREVVDGSSGSGVNGSDV